MAPARGSRDIGNRLFLNILKLFVRILQWWKEINTLDILNGSGRFQKNTAFKPQNFTRVFFTKRDKKIYYLQHKQLIQQRNVDYQGNNPFGT